MSHVTATELQPKHTLEASLEAEAIITLISCIVDITKQIKYNYLE